MIRGFIFEIGRLSDLFILIPYISTFVAKLSMNINDWIWMG